MKKRFILLALIYVGCSEPNTGCEKHTLIDGRDSCVEYYPSGRISHIYSLRNGEKIGTEFYFYENSLIKERIEYDSLSREIHKSLFDENGLCRSVINWNKFTSSYAETSFGVDGEIVSQKLKRAEESDTLLQQYVLFDTNGNVNLQGYYIIEDVNDSLVFFDFSPLAGAMINGSYLNLTFKNSKNEIVFDTSFSSFPYEDKHVKRYSDAVSLEFQYCLYDGALCSRIHMDFPPEREGQVDNEDGIRID